MTKIFHETKKTDYEIWSFPELSIEEPISQHAINNEPITSEDIPKSIAEGSEIPVASHDIEVLKNELQDLIVLFKDVNQTMNKVIQNIDSDFIEKIASLVKKTVKKLIDKELETDPKIITQIIKKASGELGEQKNCTLLISSKDFENWQKNQIKENDFLVEADPEMPLGNFKLVTPSNEVIVNFDKILNAIFKIENE